MRFFCTEYAVVHLPIVDLLGQPSFKGYVSSALSMQSSVSQSLTYRTLQSSKKCIYFALNIQLLALLLAYWTECFFFPYTAYIVFSLTTAQKLPKEFVYCCNVYQSIGLAKSTRSWDFRATVLVIPFVEARPHRAEKLVSQTPKFIYSDAGNQMRISFIYKQIRREFG